MNQYLLVFLGGGIGSALRLGTYRLARLWLPPEFPWGTFSVNVIGGLCAGLVTGWLMARSAGGADPAALFLMTGVLGGFTTFSAFNVEGTLRHPERGGDWEYSVVLSIRNERGEELSRQVVGVGALRSTEARTFTLSVDVATPGGRNK